MNEISIYRPGFGLFGMNLITDCRELIDVLGDRHLKTPDKTWSPEDSRLVSEKFPGLLDVVIDGMRKIEANRLRPNLMTYFNYRVQIWCLGFNADPSPPVLVKMVGMQYEN